MNRTALRQRTGQNGFSGDDDDGAQTRMFKLKMVWQEIDAAGKIV